MRLKLTPVQPKPSVDPWGTPDEVYRRYCFLVLAHRWLYYVGNCPVLTDRQYDLLEKYLIHLERTTGVYHERSPVRTVGSSVSDSYPKSSVKWARLISSGKVLRQVYYIDYLENHDWQNYLDSLVYDR